MKKLFFAASCALLLLSCSQNSGKTSASEVENVKNSLSALYNHADSLYAAHGRIDTAAFSEFIAGAMSYSDEFPDDSLAPIMLYRAGIGSMILAKSAKNVEYRAENAKRAIAIFNKYQSLWPENPDARLCYWQRAIVYDDILGDWRSADTEYRDFINRFPDDSLTPVFKEYIKILGVSAEEIDSRLNIK